jgi:hypothetical protein
MVAPGKRTCGVDGRRRRTIAAAADGRFAVPEIAGERLFVLIYWRMTAFPEKTLPNHDSLLLSVDIEADGPIPGPHSMLSIGAAAFDIERRLIGTFSANLLPLEGASMHHRTAAFWAENPAAWAALQSNRRPPREAMEEYSAFLESLPETPIFVGYPAPFDYLWHHWYLIHFTGDDPCGIQAFDMKSYAAAVLRCAYRDAIKRNFPERWFRGAPSHDHVALTDALGQGVMAVNMIREQLGLAPIDRDP